VSAQLASIPTPRGVIAVRHDGPPKAPALLLCQRLRGAIEDWDPRLISALAHQRRVIRFDMPGIGARAGDTPNSVHGMAPVVRALLDALGLERVDLLGWSLGGYVAQAVTLTWPDRIRRLVIAGSGPGGPDAPAAHPRVAEIAEKHQATREEIAFLFFPETEEGRAAAGEHLDLIGYGKRPPTRQESGLRQRAAIVDWTKGINAAKPRLSELAVPVLVAKRVDDAMVPAENSFVIARNAPDAKLVLYPRSGHAFLFQYADAFADEVDRFLQV
jgi:pimeloyl-ACP methyl ester carboxylesterase